MFLHSYLSDVTIGISLHAQTTAGGLNGYSCGMGWTPLLLPPYDRPHLFRYAACRSFASATTLD